MTPVDQRIGAIACLEDRELASRVGEALVGAGFEVSVAADLTDVSVSLEADADVPTVLVFDGSTDGWLGRIAKIVDRHPSVMPFLLADVDHADSFLSAIAAGVAGFCCTDAPSDAIVRAVRSMLVDGVAIPRPFVAPLVAAVRHARGHTVHTAAGDVDITDREWEILQMLVQRRTTREMADALYVSVGTVRSHVSTLLKKIGAVDRDDAIRLVQRRSPEPNGFRTVCP